jgi:hypothetical protein
VRRQAQPAVAAAARTAIANSSTLAALVSQEHMKRQPPLAMNS